MNIVDDLKSELQSARAERQWYEADWQDYVTYTAPDMERAFNRPGGITAADGMSAFQSSAARERSRKLYDPTAVWLLDRLASGVGSLTMPEGFNWHGVGFGDPFAPPPTQEDEEFFEAVRDHLFRVRASGRSGFALANRSRLLSTVKLGTGVLFPAENETSLADIRTPVHYRYVPLYEVYLLVDAQGSDCGFFRVRTLKAWQAAKEYGGNLSDKIREEAGDPKRKNAEHRFVHACFLREGGQDDAADIRKSRYESIHFEEDSKHICRRGGFFEYPLVISRWDRDGLSPYGSPPQAKLMSDIKSLQSLAKDALIASSQAVRPPIATHAQERQLDLNPGRINPGLIDEQGRPLFRPMIDTVSPGAADAQIENIREKLRVGLYGDLWQTLLEGSGRTATEANIRRKEMADMIGPFSTNIMAGNEALFEREVGILGRRGAFASGSPLAPPETIAGSDVTLKPTAPIDQMREAGHFEAIMGFQEYLGVAAASDPTLLDLHDREEEYDLTRRALGLPAKLKRRPEEVEALRQKREAETQQQQQLAAGESMAKMARDGAPLIKTLSEDGTLDGSTLPQDLGL
ncbi:Bacteriophage head to tail connecting protein [Labrenzia sp. THAF82]|uniref:portal protein n=1 Tax=Labrenzia sp. THAF82 TaxID=2587861 RepID=UPI00126982CA|nr:portal protein [Labrenzia sp. THAF82]QFT30968.1 Bacteriophage head to tail connecting protein [Labrenzia sp. THAF82]